MTAFKTSIRVEDDATFGAVIDRSGDLMISLDGSFIDGTIVLKISQDRWSDLCHAVLVAAVADARKKGYVI